MQTYWFFFLVALIKANEQQSQCPPTASWIKSLLDRAYIPGAAVIAVNSDGIIYEQSVGYHSPPISEQRQPIDSSNSIFLLASISKTFVVVAAMQMVELNRLHLDENINQYLSPHMNIIHPHYPNATITIRHLLSHTSGIGANLLEDVKIYLPGDSYTKTNFGDVLHNYLKNEGSWLPIPPGNKTFYSNTAVSLAAFIIERLANISFEQYVQDKILKPLGITTKMGGHRLSNFNDSKKNLVGHYIYNATFPPLIEDLLLRLNASYVGNSSEWLYIPFYGSSLYPSGFLRMSIQSLGRFLHSFLNNFPTLLHDSSSIKEMLHVFPQQSYMNITNVNYSLIWNWVVLGGRRLVGHQGSLFGTTNFMMANEKRTLGIIILTNGDISTPTNQTIEVGEFLIKLTTQLFDCFEMIKSTASNQHPALFYSFL